MMIWRWRRERWKTRPDWQSGGSNVFVFVVGIVLGVSLLFFFPPGKSELPYYFNYFTINWVRIL
jgi:hypothetical protein